MAQVIVKENESLESALKRFKRSCARDGVMSELRKREHYEKPSVKRKKNLPLICDRSASILMKSDGICCKCKRQDGYSIKPNCYSMRSA